MGPSGNARQYLPKLKLPIDNPICVADPMFGFAPIVGTDSKPNT
jgi:hypothetical protein